MSNKLDIILKDNYFDENNKIRTSEDSEDFTVISIKNSVSLDNLLKLENKKMSKSFIDIGIQTDYDDPLDDSIEIKTYKQQEVINNKKINELEIELHTLKIKNASLERNIKDISGLLNSFMKINIDNPKIDEIRNQLTVLVNRELRLHHAVPFMSFLSKYSK
jgi:hypothetical protein